jgi:arsenate reductase
MAEGIARRLFGDRAAISSAGSMAAGVDPESVAALADIGIDISHHTSKSVRTIDLSAVDIVITLCEGEVCPTVPGKTFERLHWPLRDPVGDQDDLRAVRFRETRDELQRRLAEFGIERGLIAKKRN